MATDEARSRAEPAAPTPLIHVDPQVERVAEISVDRAPPAREPGQVKPLAGLEFPIRQFDAAAVEFLLVVMAAAVAEVEREDQVAPRAEIDRGGRLVLEDRTEFDFLTRPHRGGRQHQRAVANWIRDNLPMFKFNSRLNRWEAPLEELQSAVETFDGGCTLSQGVKEYLTLESEE